MRVDAARLRAALLSREDSSVGSVDVFAELESTNRYLLERPPDQPGKLHLCIAEHQSQGRGRHGRQWYAPRSAGLCLSASWLFAVSPSAPATIALATGVAVQRALESVCGLTVELKWPNDLIWGGRKLGGILVELASSTTQRCHVVIGIGINVALPETALAIVSDWPTGAIDLRTALQGAVPDRTALAVELGLRLARLCHDYERDGFAAYCTAWRRADHLVDAAVVVHRGNVELRGTARGIDDAGRLLVHDDTGHLHRIASGDVSVRPA